MGGISSGQPRMEEKKSLKKSFAMAAAVILALLAIGLYFQSNFTGFIIFPGQEKIFYIRPANCPDEICNTDSLRTWASDAGINLGIYDSNSVAVPIAMVFKDGDAFVINTASKRAFSNDLCAIVNVTGACRVFEDNIQKSDVVTLNFFTSLFSENDVRLKIIAINLKQVLNESVNVIPRFIIITDLDGPGSENAAEVHEVMRQLCLLQTQPNSWVPYATCIDSALLTNQWTANTWEACAQTAVIDMDSMNGCVQGRGLQLAKSEQNTVKQLKLQSTPILFINSDVYTSRHTFDAVKKTACMYFNKKLGAC